MISGNAKAWDKATAVALINIETTGKGFSLATRDEILQQLAQFGYYGLECHSVYLSGRARVSLLPLGGKGEPCPRKRRRHTWFDPPTLILVFVHLFGCLNSTNRRTGVDRPENMFHHIG